MFFRRTKRLFANPRKNIYFRNAFLFVKTDFPLSYFYFFFFLYFEEMRAL